MPANFTLNILCLKPNDDSPVLTNFLLGVPNVKLIVAVTWDEAWDGLRSTDYDLCVLDTAAGNEGAIALCRDIRAQLPRIPIIFYSAWASNQAIHDAYAAGGTAYFMKHNLRDLCDAIVRTAELAQFRGRKLHRGSDLRF